MHRTRANARHRSSVRFRGFEVAVATDSPHAAAEVVQMCGPVVYFVRCLDGRIKIGYASDLSNRLAGLGVGWTSLLAIMPGGRDAERHLHETFRHLRIYGAEYFEPGSDLVEHINQLRLALGVPAVAPWERVSLPPLVELDNDHQSPSP